MTQAQATFARALADGADPETAYRTAYPAAHDMRPETLAAKAAALATSPAIVAAVERMQQTGTGTAAAPMTPAEAVAVLTATARRIHAENGRPADLVKTVALLARLAEWDAPGERVALADLSPIERGEYNRAEVNGEEVTPDDIRADSVLIADYFRAKYGTGVLDKAIAANERGLIYALGPKHLDDDDDGEDIDAGEDGED